jgi:acetylornithine deacetylase/succinyl-diaminopimelate desuccinylase-like protein
MQLRMLSNSIFGLLCLVSAAAAHEQQPLVAPSETATAASLGDAPSYRSSLLALHKSLVSIPSVSGTEQKVGTALVEYLTSLGYIVEQQALPQPEAESNSSVADNTQPRFNVLASLPVQKHRRGASKPRVLVSSHIDVVPPHIPYSISDAIHPGPDTVISGRGSVDAKASVAAQIVALEELRRQGDVDVDEVMLLFVVGEETVGDGMRFFSSVAQKTHLEFDAAIFGEPTENKLACGHKGHASCTINAKGKAGHSGYPWLGKSATEVLVRALVRVLDRDLGSSERFGNTTVNVGLIEGGVAANVIPEHASSRIALRIAAGDQKTGWNVVKDRLSDILKEVDDEALSMECSNGYGPIECNCDVQGRLTIQQPKGVSLT